MKLPEALIAHSIQGRVRVRIPSERGDVEYFERVADALRAAPGVRDVRVNPTTGSVLIRYDGEIRLRELGAARELFSLTDELTHQKPLLAQVAAGFRGGSSGLREASRGKLDVDSVAFLAYACAGIYQISRGKALPAGLTLLHYALDLIALQRPDQPSRNAET